MCGRFVQISPAEELMNEFGIDEVACSIHPNYNVAPAQNIVLVKEDRKRVLMSCRWGFLPHWAKDESVGSRMINARAESVAEKPSFRNAFKNGRCIAVADGFYEWKKGRVKTPVYVRMNSGRPIGFAGLYSLWTSPENTDICTCTIITTEANDLLDSIHDRMPVILQKDSYDRWLDNRSYDRDELMKMLTPYDSSEMELYTVSRKVNSPSFNEAENIVPV